MLRTLAAPRVWLTSRMAVRHATAEDLADLLPLFRAYCDFYEATRPTTGSTR